MEHEFRVPVSGITDALGLEQNRIERSCGTANE
jgi:hypothetical protein